MLSDELKDLFRSEMNDEVEPYLWSDTDVYGYMDDAQKTFCRLTDGIADATTTEVCSIAVGVGDTWIELNPSILKIRSATRASDGKPVEVINHEDMPALGIRFDGSAGTLGRIVLGMEENKARADREASVADTLQLVVFRLPLLDIDGDTLALEIASQHHRHLLDWMKHLAYKKQDADTRDDKKSAEHEQAFRRYCAQVTQEQRAKRHKVRVVRYGGI